jgi:hypothetical protein
MMAADDVTIASGNDAAQLAMLILSSHDDAFERLICQPPTRANAFLVGKLDSASFPTT